MKLVRFLKENMEVRTMAKDLIRNELPKILNSFGVDTSPNSSNLTLTINQTGVVDKNAASTEPTMAGNKTNIPVKKIDNTSPDKPTTTNNSSPVKNLSPNSTTEIQAVPKKTNETKLSPAVTSSSVAPPQGKPPQAKPTSSPSLTAEAVKEDNSEKETVSPVGEAPNLTLAAQAVKEAPAKEVVLPDKEGLPSPKAGFASVKDPSSPLLVSQAVKEPPTPSASPLLASHPVQETPIPGPRLGSGTSITQTKLISAAAPEPKSISTTAPISALASATFSTAPSITSKSLLHPVGAKPAVSSYKSAGTILAAPSLVSPRSKRSVEEPEDSYNFDPLKDLENSKQNLKRYIFDENKNDINLLHDLEEKLKSEEGFQANEDYFLSPDPVKESPSSDNQDEGLVYPSSENATVKESPEGEQLAKVLKQIVLEAEKVHIADAKKIAQRAVAELVNAGEKKLRRRKRSIPNLHKVESDALSHILKEVYELQGLIKANNEHSSEDKSGLTYHIQTEKKELDLEGASIESSLLDQVTTLLSRSAVDQMLGGAATRSTSFTKVPLLPLLLLMCRCSKKT